MRPTPYRCGMLGCVNDGSDRPLVLVPLTESGAQTVASWFDVDAAGQREFGGFYGRHPKWWSVVSGDERRFGWIVSAGAEEVGFVDVGLDDVGDASVAVYVRREYRNRGTGREILRQAAAVATRLGRGPSMEESTRPTSRVFAPGSPRAVSPKAWIRTAT